MIQLKEIEKYHRHGPQKVWVLNQVNLTIQPGEFVTIMGPSGAGKTTLLNIIGMLEQADGGEYYFMDEPVHQLNEKRRHELHKHYMGFVFQAYHLIDDLTVYENISYPELPVRTLNIYVAGRLKSTVTFKYGEAERGPFRITVEPSDIESGRINVRLVPGGETSTGKFWGIWDVFLSDKKDLN